jgi:hypothetical protein
MHCVYQATQRIHVRRGGQDFIEDILWSWGGDVSAIVLRVTRGIALTNVIERPLCVGRHPAIIRREFPLARGAIWPLKGNGEAQTAQFPVAL